MRPDIVVADRDTGLTQALQQVLGPTYWVESVADGPHLMTTIERLVPDVVVLSTDLWSTDSYQIVRRVRRDPRLRGTLVVLVSPADRPEEVSRAFAEGADDHLVRPIPACQLATRILISLRRRAA